MLLTLLSLLPLVSARDVPQLEVLFYSSDETLALHPGGLQSGHQLAKYQPRRKVDVAYKKGFPSPSDFYTNFVERRRPVIFSSAVGTSQYDFLKLENLNTSSRAALSFTSVSSFTSQEKQTESIRNFVNQKMGEALYLSEHLHKNLKALTVLPECLQCSHLAHVLFDTTHSIVGHVYPLPVKQVGGRLSSFRLILLLISLFFSEISGVFSFQNVHDVLHCQLDGSKEILLIDSREFPEVSRVLDISSPPHGTASFLNTLAVDYERYPSLKEISLFHIALLGPGEIIRSSQY